MIVLDIYAWLCRVSAPSRLSRAAQRSIQKILAGRLLIGGVLATQGALKATGFLHTQFCPSPICKNSSS
jgi:hypothetical protein